MALLVSFNLLDNSRTFKAPRMMLFDIEAINFSHNIALDTFILVLARQVEGEDLSDSLNDEDILASSSSVLQGNDLVDHINEETKFITIGKTNAGAVNTRVEIYGTLKKATKKDLLIEWFRKGR